MAANDKGYFVLINYRTRERYLCSWHQDEPDFWRQKVHYIGVTNGIGGLNYMREKGFEIRAYNQSSRLLWRCKSVHNYYMRKIGLTSWQVK